jgi:hypothetical protein
MDNGVGEIFLFLVTFSTNLFCNVEEIFFELVKQIFLNALILPMIVDHKI